MNKLFSLICLILLTLISCEDKSDSKMGLLEGTWKNTESNFPIITFYEDGNYVNTDLFRVPLPSGLGINVLPEKVIISGNFILKNNKIEFITSNVEEISDSNDDVIGDTSGVIIAPGQPIINFYYDPRTPENFTPTNNQLIPNINPQTSNNISSTNNQLIPNNNPRIWEMIHLTENELKVKYILDTLTFQRQ